MRRTNFGPATATAAALEDEPELPEEPPAELGREPGSGGGGVEAPNSNNRTVPSTTGSGPSFGFSLRCSMLLNSSATSSSALLSIPRLQSKLRNPPLPAAPRNLMSRSEEHTSELQSLAYLVCRLLLEKKKKK